jgi:hypothetical protein
MAYNNERANVHGPLVLDIETYQLETAGEFIDDGSAPANYKDPLKIAAYIAEDKAARLNRCALDPDLCRVVAIGLQRSGDEPQTGVLGTLDDETERKLLSWFWNQVQLPDTFIGFNHLAFDLPVLIRRSQYLDVLHPRVNLDRFRTPHIDLMQLLSFNGALKFRGLEFYCKRFGIKVADSTTGKDMAALVKAGDWQGVRAHCLADIQKTAALARRIGVLAEQEVAEVL